MTKQEQQQALWNARKDSEQLNEHDTQYAQTKQLHSLQLQSNQGDIVLTAWETQQLFEYMQELLSTRDARFRGDTDYFNLKKTSQPS